jgi:hypothetical protein
MFEDSSSGKHRVFKKTGGGTRAKSFSRIEFLLANQSGCHAIMAWDMGKLRSVSIQLQLGVRLGVRRDQASAFRAAEA